MGSVDSFIGRSPAWKGASGQYERRKALLQPSIRAVACAEATFGPLLLATILQAPYRGAFQNYVGAL